MCYALHHAPAKMIPGRPERGWMDAFSERHPYRCLPLVLANVSGWDLLSPVAFRATWDGAPETAAIRVEAAEGEDPAAVAAFAASHFGGGVLTMHTGWLFRTPSGWDLSVAGPPNRPKHGIAALSGVVEADWLPFPFTMNWAFTAPGAVEFTRDEPFCFVAPVPHVSLDAFEPVVKPLDAEPDLKRDCEAWGASRAGFISAQQAGDPAARAAGWQKSYFRGEGVGGGRSAGARHIVRRRLAPPRPARDGE